LRYGKFSVLAEEIVGTMRGAIALGRTNHNVSMKGVLEQCRYHQPTDPGSAALL
jgi:hypothetical protein